MGTDSNSENEEASFVEFRRNPIFWPCQRGGTERAGVEIRIRGRLLPPARSRLTLAAREEAGGP